MADQTLKKRLEGCASRIFVSGAMTWFVIMALARSVGGTQGVERLTMILPIPVLIIWGALMTWCFALNRNQMVRRHMETVNHELKTCAVNITAWKSLPPAEMEEVVHTLAAKIRDGKLYALNISILPGKDGAMLLSGIINEGQGVRAITQLTQQGTNDPSGALSSAHLKGDRE